MNDLPLRLSSCGTPRVRQPETSDTLRRQVPPGFYSPVAPGVFAGAYENLRVVIQRRGEEAKPAGVERAPG